MEENVLDINCHYSDPHVSTKIVDEMTTILDELDRIDHKCIRPMATILVGDPTIEDYAILEKFVERAEELRNRLRVLKGL